MAGRLAKIGFNGTSLNCRKDMGGEMRKQVVIQVLALAICLSLMVIARPSIAGPAEEANAALDRFSEAYTANDVEALVKLYAPNAILLGTNSPIISEGHDAVRAYFTNLKLAGSGNKNEIQERRTIVERIISTTSRQCSTVACSNP